MKRQIKGIGAQTQPDHDTVDPALKNKAVKIPPKSICHLCRYCSRLVYNARGLVVCSWSMKETPESKPIDKCSNYECVI